MISWLHQTNVLASAPLPAFSIMVCLAAELISYVAASMADHLTSTETGPFGLERIPLTFSSFI